MPTLQEILAAAKNPADRKAIVEALGIEAPKAPKRKTKSNGKANAEPLTFTILPGLYPGFFQITAPALVADETTRTAFKLALYAGHRRGGFNRKTGLWYGSDENRAAVVKTLVSAGYRES